MTIQEFFKENPNIAVALSGGVDSAVLLLLAKKYAVNVVAYFVKTQFQPEFELLDAIKISTQLDVAIEIINVDVLSNESIASNPDNRCYYCKHMIFNSIIERLNKNIFSYTVVDGTNASDNIEDRQGTRAVRELGVLSPLRMCGITKKQIREIARENNLSVSDKPSYACLATRVPFNDRITQDILKKTELAEKELFNIGFKDFRVRYSNGNAVLQLSQEDMKLLLDNRISVTNILLRYYDNIFLDLKVRVGE